MSIEIRDFLGMGRERVLTHIASILLELWAVHVYDDGGKGGGVGTHIVGMQDVDSANKK